MVSWAWDVPKAQTSSAQGKTLGICDGDSTQIIPEPHGGDPRRLALIRADDARCRGSSFQDSASRRVVFSPVPRALPWAEEGRALGTRDPDHPGSEGLTIGSD